MIRLLASFVTLVLLVVIIAAGGGYFLAAICALPPFQSIVIFLIAEGMVLIAAAIVVVLKASPFMLPFLADGEHCPDCGAKLEEIPDSDKPRRNDPCPCGSGKKYKHCCGRGNR